MAAISTSEGSPYQISSLRGNCLFWWLVLGLGLGFGFAPDFCEGSLYLGSFSSHLARASMPCPVIACPRPEGTTSPVCPGLSPRPRTPSIADKLAQLVTIALPHYQGETCSTPNSWTHYCRPSLCLCHCLCPSSTKTLLLSPNSPMQQNAFPK